MSELECFFSFFLCCHACESCIDINDNKNNDENKNLTFKEDIEALNVIFFYDKNDEKIDKNIDKIIFYDEYIKGYYDEYHFDPNKKQILLIYNKNNIKDISTIINYIHINNGLSLKKETKKWVPKYIWIFN